MFDSNILKLHLYLSSNLNDWLSLINFVSLYIFLLSKYAADS